MVSATSQPAVILVTGATRGIGRAVTERLAIRGHVVLLGSRDLDRGRAVARDIPGEVRVANIDVTNRTSIQRTYELVRDEFGYFDGLNNAGINVSWDLPPCQTRIEDMRAVFDTDVFGVVEVTSTFIPLLRESCAQRVVNVRAYGVLSLRRTSELNHGLPRTAPQCPASTPSRGC